MGVVSPSRVDDENIFGALSKGSAPWSCSLDADFLMALCALLGCISSTGRWNRDDLFGVLSGENVIVDARGAIAVFGAAIGDGIVASNSSADELAGDFACSRRAASLAGEGIEVDRFCRVHADIDESAQVSDYCSRT